MKKSYLVGIIVVVVVIGAVVVLKNYNVGGQPLGSASNTPTASTDSSGKVKFTDTDNAQYAYLISTDAYDTQTQAALSGFTVDKKTQPDGSMSVTLTAHKAGYVSQSYTVMPGEKLYFIERSLGDDGDNDDATLADDHAVLVDANGYVVQ